MPRATNRSRLRGLIVASVLATGVASVGLAHAASGPFANMSGVWSGRGTVTLDDGSQERLRCRATYAVRRDGNALNQTLLCASDSYKFDLHSNVVARGSELSGSWSEASRGIQGNLSGRASAGRIDVSADAPGFNATLSVTTRGNRQSVIIRGQGSFRAATLNLVRS